MRRPRPTLAAVLVMLAAILIQTTVFARFRAFPPDLVMLTSALLAMTSIRHEAAIVVAFGGGLVIDLMGSSLLGLRAMAMAAVAFTAVRTRERADIGRIGVAIWVGLLTLLGIVLLLLVGTLFDQRSLLGDRVLSRIAFIPLANTVLSMLIAPFVVRVISRGSSYTFA